MKRTSKKIGSRHIAISALSVEHAKEKVKLDEHLGPDIVITKVDVLRKAGTHGWKDGVYNIYYRKK
jgi:hypothetical protein